MEPKKVIIVDDNPFSIEGLLINIDWAGLNTQVCKTLNDAQDVLSIISEQPVDMILSDIRMPGMDGLEMSRKILECRPTIKIILISAYDNFEYAQQAVRIGAFDYVEKPIDYEYLTTIIRNASEQIDKERKNLEQLKRSLPALIENFFKDLIHTNADEAQFSLAEYPQYLNLDLNFSQYNCSVVKIENSNELKSTLGIEKYYVILMNLCDDIRNCFQDFPLCYYLNEIDGIVILLAKDHCVSNVFLQLVNDAFAALAKQYEHSQVSFNIGIGSLVTDLWHLCISYEKARGALEYRFFFPQKIIFDSRDSMNQDDSGFWADESISDRIIEALCKKDMQSVEAYIRQLSESLFEKCGTKENVFLQIYSILGKILKLLYDMGIPATEIQKEMIAAYNQLDNFSTSTQICGWLNHICSMTYQQMEESISSYYLRVSKSICDYIGKNYSDPDLCLNDLALYVNISPAHLSAVFKKTNGQSISDVITGERIQSAQHLLEYSSLSIKEISEKVGYANQYYFSACFKKKTGQTPSGYRMQLDENKIL